MESRVSQIGLASTTSRAVVESIFRFKTRFIGTFAAVLLVIAVYTLLAPRHYKSEMSIVVGGEHAWHETKTEQTNASLTPVIPWEDQVNPAIEILRSRDVADKVLTPASELSSIVKKPKADITLHERSIEEFNRNLIVEQFRKSNVIHAAYTAKSPRAATETLQRLLEIFLKKQQELQAASTTSTFFAAEQQRYRHELDTAQQELATYQQKSHIVSPSDNESALARQIIQLKQQIQETDIGISELSERVAIGRKELQGLAQRQVTQQKSVPNVLAIEQLSTMLAGYRNQKTALLTKYQPTDRLVQEADQQIVNTSEALHSATETHSSEETTDVNPVWQQVSSVMSQNALDRSAAWARRRSQMMHLAELEASLSTIENSAATFNRLQNKASELQEAYQLYTRKRNEEQMADEVDQHEPAVFTIAQQPTFSATPSSPSLIFTLLTALIVAPFLAFSVVFISELQRDTIASPSEFRAISRIPLLTIMPFIHADYLRSKSRAASEDKLSKEEQPGAIRFSPLLDKIRSFSRFPLQATASIFMGSTSSGPANRGPTAKISAPMSLSQGLSP